MYNWAIERIVDDGGVLDLFTFWLLLSLFYIRDQMKVQRKFCPSQISSESTSIDREQ